MWLLSPAKVDGPKSIATCDLPRDEEVVLSEPPGTLPNVVAPITEGVDGDLRSLVEPETIDVQHGNGNA